MRGIKINPTNRTIGEVDVPNPNKSLQGLYDLIGCDLVQLVELDRGIVMACDEEAKCRKITGAFTFYGTDLIIAGNAVILGGDAERFAKLHENMPLLHFVKNSPQMMILRLLFGRLKILRRMYSRSLYPYAWRSIVRTLLLNPSMVALVTFPKCQNPRIPSLGRLFILTSYLVV